MAVASSHSTSSKKKKIELDSDAFDCPICAVSLIGKIYQCPRGHHLCEACLKEVLGRPERSCPTCRTKFPEEVARTLALEAIAASCSFPCRWGCDVEGCPAILQPHLAKCFKGPAMCPIRDCQQGKVAADELAHHLQTAHQAVERQSGVIFKYIFSDFNPGVFNPCLVTSSYGTLLFKLRFCKEGGDTPSLFRANVQHFTGPPKRFAFKLHGPGGQWLARCGTSSFVRAAIEKDQIVFNRETIDPMVHEAEGAAKERYFMNLELCIQGVVEEDSSPSERSERAAAGGC